jgi:hypothetical protein
MLPRILLRWRSSISVTLIFLRRPRTLPVFRITLPLLCQAGFGFWGFDSAQLTTSSARLTRISALLTNFSGGLI